MRQLWINLREYCIRHWKINKRVIDWHLCLEFHFGFTEVSFNIQQFLNHFSSTEPQTSRTSDNYVSVEFLTWPIIRYKREVLFGWVDLLVSFGGIAGLFLGFSLLSGVEIAYYFTMRTFCMLYKNRVRIIKLIKSIWFLISHSISHSYQQQELYEIEEEKLSKPPKRINLSLSLIRNTANESNFSTEHRVEINEISSRIEPSNQTTTAFGPNSVLQEDYNDGKARINQLHMTRVAKKVAAVRVNY